MAGTLKESLDSKHAPPLRLLTVALRYDDALRPPAEVFSWGGEKVRLGRGDADALQKGRLTLKDPRVSVDHAELSLVGDQVWLQDLGSSNGTWVDGRKVVGQVELRDGDAIELGRTVLVYRRAPASQAMAVVGGPGHKAGARLGRLRTLNPTLADTFMRLARVAGTAQPALLVGETGTGKEVLATEVHHLSGRKGELVAVDCGAIPDNLFESTLFGHEKGAFTGATEARVGEIARAHKGTLFLDEVGNLTAQGQAKLLRVLETRKVTPLGGAKTQEVDVRWLAATNRFVTDDDDDFRSDLLHRLAGFVVTLPPLRERREDLGLLIAALLEAMGAESASLTPKAGRVLVNHPLTGNVRQLRNVLGRATHGGNTVLVGEEALGVLEAAPEARPPRASGGRETLDETREDRPRRAQPSKGELEEALERAQGNVAEAARSLKTSPRQLYRWLERAGIDPESFRQDA